MKSKIKVYHFPFNQRTICLTIVTPPNQRGYCFKCHLEKEIWVISERKIGLLEYDEERKFCYFCALQSLTKLENGDCNFDHKKEMIKEIRALLKVEPKSEKNQEILECYA